MSELFPKPVKRDSFRRSRERFLPDSSGCYVLTTFDGTILYIGLTAGIRRRMIQHLDTPKKVASTPLGRATWIYWFETPETNKVERTWLNIHLSAEGSLPILNSRYSPTST
ncbi:GIY-YIG nuclease family protein [Sphingomonas flavalba]|uniref:GIY-YIG nuclease family protein n=1 Tax=Sphingomonas flavalba TaxID=2559804 RepID=UPI0039E1D363